MNNAEAAAVRERLEGHLIAYLARNHDSLKSIKAALGEERGNAFEDVIKEAFKLGYQRGVSDGIQYGGDAVVKELGLDA